ncbi:MAG: anthranilate phosphoribosyltransferase [Acidiferrobacteraceae bacterium]|nr:anthranilate phosphoribosyltransferase [Acidiferrobacteraceae bacterium]
MIAMQKDVSSDVDMYTCLQKIATGPELSKNLSEREAYSAMSLILEERVDEVQAAIFLIALRMKRETDEELLGILKALKQSSIQVIADVPEVLDLSDPFDGYTRSLPAGPFLLPILASLGIPSVSQGVDSMGPKFGLTHFQVLQAAGIDTSLDPTAAANQLSDTSIGWAYVDQSYANPPLNSLRDLRTRIVKRPCLTTLEVLLMPIRGACSTHLMTGYVHKPYPPIYTMLARASGYTSAMVIRGIEGGIFASLNQPSRLTRFFGDGQDEELRLDPQGAGVHCLTRGTPLPDEGLQTSKLHMTVAGASNNSLAHFAAAAGREALAGSAGPTRNSLLYAAAQCLFHLGRVDSLRAGVDKTASMIDSGEPLARFERVCTPRVQ